MKKYLSWILVVIMIVSSLAGCGSGDTEPSDGVPAGGADSVESTEAPAESPETESDASDGAASIEEEAQNSLTQALNYNGLNTEPFETEEEAMAFVTETSMNDAFSASVFYMSEADRIIFSDGGYPDARDELVEEIIARAETLESDTGSLIKVIDALQAGLLRTVNALDSETLPPYFDGMYAIHGTYMADIIDGQLSVEALKESLEMEQADPYMESWYQELIVNTRVMNSITAVDYLNQLLVDGVILSEYVGTLGNDAVLSELEDSLMKVDESVSAYEAVVNGKRDVVAMIESLKESDEYFALATAKAVMESADAAKALLKEQFPEGTLSEEELALIDAQIDFYVQASEVLYNEVLETSEFALVLPEAQTASEPSTVQTWLFGIAYADENSEAVQLKDKATEVTKKRNTSVFSVVGSLFGMAKDVVVGTVDIATNVVSKSADVVYGTAKGVVSTLKFAVGIDDSKAFKQQLDSIGKMITGTPGAAARDLIKVADDLSTGIEGKIKKALKYIPMGDVAEETLTTMARGYTGLIKSAANVFDGKQPAFSKVMSIFETYGQLNGNILTNAKEMLKSAAGEKLQSIMPESMKSFYNAMVDISKSVKGEVAGIRQALEEKVLNSDVVQKGKKLYDGVNQLDKNIKQIPEKLIENFGQTQTAEESGTRKITEVAQKKAEEVPAQEGEAKRWPFLTKEMQVFLIGFEEDLRAKALVEVAKDIEEMSTSSVYSGYMAKVRYGGGSQTIGSGNSKVTFTFNEKGADVNFAISGTGLIDSSGTLKFPSYTLEGDHLKMSLSNSFIGPISIDGTLTSGTFTGVMSFSLEKAPASMTFHSSRVEK